MLLSMNEILEGEGRMGVALLTSKGDSINSTHGNEVRRSIIALSHCFSRIEFLEGKTRIE